jgi:tartrate-resistant acid phosphatase type 5
MRSFIVNAGTESYFFSETMNKQGVKTVMKKKKGLTANISFFFLPEIVDFFFVDTTPFQLKYWTHPKDDHYDWRGVAPREKYLANLLKVHILNELINDKQAIMMLQSKIISNLFRCVGGQDLDEAMKKSTATWRVAVGHHTMRSVSDHGDTKELLQLLLPVLQVT